jgi:hypothetical protein
MDLVNDAKTMFQDLGVTAEFGDATAKVFFDAPGSDIDIGGVTVCATEPSILFVTGALPGLVRGSLITVNGTDYIVRDIKPQDDGVVSRATLKVSQ